MSRSNGRRGGAVKRPSQDEEDRARFEGEGGRGVDEPEVRHFWDEFPHASAQPGAKPKEPTEHWSEYVVDSPKLGSAGGASPNADPRRS